ncbi:hypothetical protein ACJRO7_008728 [Eucalyptus globulus]|uniref:Cysteine protease n=1 Tax=Eucalyptus globulus TaxID=34317 RepID=A0ABD3ISX0_EUCGL
MKGFCEKAVASKCLSESPSDTSNTSQPSVCPEAGYVDSKSSRNSSWSTFFGSAFSIFDAHCESSACPRKALHSRPNAWTTAVRKVVTGGSMRRIQERVLGTGRTGISNPTSDIWLLGVCYKISQDESSGDEVPGLPAFEQDFSSRIIITYRKGFEAIDSNYTSDVGWGCMLRSSQMLVAQALLFHHLGRSWRKTSYKPCEPKYADILHLFGDSNASPFSIHNLIQAGKAYDLAAGSWVGPYATCRSWESLVRSKREAADLVERVFPIALYIVSGDEDGERGGAPVLCIEDARKCCSEFSRGQDEWTPILLLVPLVLGLEKVNPRYIPLLRATFSFPQSLGILGGKPGASTYLIGVQDDEAFYLDPHDVQPVCSISTDNLDSDTSSYHCNVIRRIPLDSLDPSLAIGFYCRDKDDFDDFCSRASKLADDSSGAPLFTVAQTHSTPKPVGNSGDSTEGGIVEGNNPFSVIPMGDGDGSAGEDEWQLL